MALRFTENELKHIKSTMMVFFNTTEIPCLLVDEDGKELYEEGGKKNYCLKVAKNANDSCLCQNAHKHFGRQSEEIGEAYISYCPAGLIHYTVALKIGETYKGAILAGPVHMSEPDTYEVDQTISNFAIPINERGLLVTYYRSVPIVSPTTARFQLQLLTLLAKEITDDSKTHLEKQKAFYDEQRQINEAVQELKEIESMSTITGKTYPVQLEKDLSSAIIKGDEQQAKAILNELLGFIFFKFMGDNNKIISMSIELIVVMTRAALEGGAAYDTVAKLTEGIYLKAFETDDIEPVCNWLIDILEGLVRIVFPIDSEKEELTGMIRKAIIFMNQNIYESISLDDVASSIGLSPTYFSRVFSNHMKMTFIEYMNKIRIEESKKYLVNRQESLSDISQRLGYSDQSYFSKVFKKYQGMTPGKYRKMYY